MGTYPSVYYRTNEVKVLPAMFSNKYSEDDVCVFLSKQFKFCIENSWYFCPFKPERFRLNPFDENAFGFLFVPDLIRSYSLSSNTWSVLIKNWSIPLVSTPKMSPRSKQTAINCNSYHCSHQRVWINTLFRIPTYNYHLWVKLESLIWCSSIKKVFSMIFIIKGVLNARDWVICHIWHE